MYVDPLAAAIDWLDAYRAEDLEAILGMYSDDAVILCGCGGMKKIAGEQGLRSYWKEHLRDYPASDLNNLHLEGDRAVVSYFTNGRVVTSVLTFDTGGKIDSHICGLSN